MMFTVLFAMMFKWLPDTPDRLARRVARRDPDRGAVRLCHASDRE
jgi:hypothetical protein